MRTLVRVVTSSESAARDAAAIAGGIPARALMQRAGAAAAGEIALRFRERLAGGALVLAGPGNNGGDAWVVARALAAAGARVRVLEPIAAKSPDAIAERALARDVLAPDAIVDRATPESFAGYAIIVDGLLGTGAAGAARGAIADAIRHANATRDNGAVVVALDLPSGLDATTGEASGEVVLADLTLTFATIKRGHLVNRDCCGDVVVLDIGLGSFAELKDGASRLVDEAWVSRQVPGIAASAHKGVRKKIAFVGGATGMAGAVVLSARAAQRSGAGMAKLIVSPDSLTAVQQTEPSSLAATWPTDDAAADRDIADWADCVVVGPGLGRGDASRELLERVLRRWRGPTLLDADALTLFEGRAADLAELLAGRPTLITPHPAEFGRLAGVTVDQVLAARFEIGHDMAARLQASVLLKGVPTVITSPAGDVLISASGTPALATAGSGDVLSGIAGTLLAQVNDPLVAGAAAAWVHGRAAERVPRTEGAGVRGISLDDIVNELRDSWTFDARPGRYPVLAELADVAGTR
ncbi:MAG TPA: NAD(P)H-hydrate dehydratase [Gemmatimonadaceae bacterium]|nr:NAD(P)H-hydrate dehydratase [Gemmatimonadaceae bacterium]